MKNWYAIYVRPRAEKKVAAGLAEAGIEHFLPLRRTLRRWSDRKKWVDLPLIPGYCFVLLHRKNLVSALRVTHVLSVVRFNGEPAIIPDMQIEFLRRMLNQSEINYKLTSQMPKPGQKVEIIAGPFIGLMAEMVKAKNKTKIYLRLEQIGSAISIEIPADQVILAGETVSLACREWDIRM